MTRSTWGAALGAGALLAVAGGATAGLFDDVELSQSAKDALVVYFDARVGVNTTGDVVDSWDGFDGEGDVIVANLVSLPRPGGGAPELITTDGETVIFSDSTVSAEGRRLEGVLSTAASGSTYTIIWRGHYDSDNANGFESSGLYAYNIGSEMSHQRDDAAGGFRAELYDGSTTWPCDDITAVDDQDSVWTTIYRPGAHSATVNGVDLNPDGPPAYDVPDDPTMIMGAFSSGGFDMLGQIGQFVIFEAELSPEDLAAVEAYFASLNPQPIQTPGLAFTEFSSDQVSVLAPGALTPEVIVENAPPGGDFIDGPELISADVAAGKLYWADYNTARIMRANLDGTGVEVITEGDMFQPVHALVVPELGQVFFSDSGNDEIEVVNIDGSGRQVVVSGEEFVDRPWGLDVDVVNGHIYWCTAVGGNVARADLDGSNLTPLFAGADLALDWTLRDVELDLANNRLFFLISNTGEIGVYQLGDEFPSPLYGELGGLLEQVEYRASTDEIYFTNYSGDTIARAPASGAGGVEVFVENLEGPVGVVLLEAAGQIIFTEFDGDRINIADIDGSNIDQIIPSDEVVTILDGPELMSYDPCAGKLYWGDFSSNRILRANLDGSDVEVVAEGDLDAPTHALVVPSLGKVFFTDSGNDEIEVANLDGSEREVFASGEAEVDRPWGIDIDLVNGRVYWCTVNGGNISRADLDGSNVTRLFGPADLPAGGDLRDLELDVDANLVYYLDSASDVVGVAGLDGLTPPANLYEGLGGLPEQIELDFATGLLYFTNFSNGTLSRAPASGAGPIEDVLIGLAGPVGVTLLDDGTDPCDPVEPCDGDANGDDMVDSVDLNIVLSNFGEVTGEGDVNGDGVVNSEDLNIVLAAFGDVC